MKKIAMKLIRNISGELKALECHGVYSITRTNGITKIRMKSSEFFKEFSTHSILIKNDVCYPYVNIYDDDMQIIGVYETKMRWDVYNKRNEDFIKEHQK